MTPRIAWRAEAALLLASAIWGFAFVAQRAGMEHVGPFLFNAARFALGALTLVPLLVWRGAGARAPRSPHDRSWSGGVLAGCALFLGASLQQWGIVHTTAGKAGFITGLYVVLVPLFGLALGHRTRAAAWTGAAIAVAGLFLLSIDERLRIGGGDLLVLGSTLFWATHILILDALGPRIRPLVVAFAQFTTCSVLSAIVAVWREPIDLAAVRAAALPIAYGGVLSSGVAYTLQIVGQRGTPPAHAAILLSLESLFAAIGGSLLLHESLSVRQAAGCALMLGGAVVSQLGGLAPRSAAKAAACLAFGLLAGVSCGRRTAPESHLVWSTGLVRGAYGGGDLVRDGAATWIAYEEAPDPGRAAVRIVRVPDASHPTERRAPPPPALASFEGGSPSLARVADGFVAVHVLQARDGTPRVVWRRGSADGRTWSPPQPVSPRAADVANHRFVVLRDGTWCIAARTAPVAPDSNAHAVLFRSRDAGATWDALQAVARPDLDAPAFVEGVDGSWIVVVRTGTSLAWTESRDGGGTWSPLAAGPRAEEHAWHALGGGAPPLLAWTDAAPDSGVALPAVRALRVAPLAEACVGAVGVPVVWRAGTLAAMPALVQDGGRLQVLFTEQGERSGALACVWRRPDASGGNAARGALRAWVEHTLARPATSQRLFIEGYFQRGLVAAEEATRGAPLDDAPLDLGAAVQRASNFADWLLSGQSTAGYWPLGYKAMYLADMGAVVQLYADLERHVEPERARQFVASAERFATAMQRDGMLLASGAVGIGWPETRIIGEEHADRRPYLVATALAGVATHAWLHAHTGRDAYRARALAELDWTLSRLAPDGSLAGFDDGGTVREGPYLTAAYVQEGWMAADAYLGHVARSRLRRALPAHVDWVVRSQLPDGTWDSGADGEFARTPPIVCFLLWYEAHIEKRAGVRAAIERAAAHFTDVASWAAPPHGLLRAGKHEEVQRALAGRVLAALAEAER